MFSFFPLVMLTLSILVSIVGSSEIAMNRLSGILTNLTPVGAGVVMGWVRSVGKTQPLAWGFGIVALIWGARHVFNILALSASIIWGRKGWKDVLLRQLVALALVGFAALMLLASIFLPGVIERIAADAGQTLGRALTAALLLVPYVFSFLTFFTVYFLTSPRRAPRKNIWLVSAVMSLTWEVAKNAFLAYIKMTNVTSVYGSIGGVIVLMTWIYFSSAIILWGMELVAASSTGPREPTHLERDTGVLVIE
jgi:membrane protein